MVRVLFDTSTLIAASLPEHPGHASAQDCLRKIHRGEAEGFVSNHTIAELYAVLTGIKRSPRMTPSTAKALIDNNLAPFTKVELKKITLQF